MGFISCGKECGRDLGNQGEKDFIMKGGDEFIQQKLASR